MSRRRRNSRPLHSDRAGGVPEHPLYPRVPPPIEPDSRMRGGPLRDPDLDDDDDDARAYASIADLPTDDAPRAVPTDHQVSELMGRVDIGELLPARTTGRPPIEMTSQLRRQLVALAQIHCTMEEISAVTEISHDVLLHRPEFRELILAGRARGRASLRRLQFQKAVDGNVPMLIWLGKNLLGQMDRAVLGGAGQPDGDDDFTTAPSNSNVNLGGGDGDTPSPVDPAVTEATAAAVVDELRARLDAIRRNRLASTSHADNAVARHDGAHATPTLDDSPVTDPARVLPPPPPLTQQAVTARRGFTFTPHGEPPRSPEFGGSQRPPSRRRTP